MTEKTIGRNEPCPCGSGKKYKRCCGVQAAPKLTVSTGSDFDPNALAQQFDPAMMAQFSQAFQRLPKGQMQRLQSLMEKAMHGKDITQEAESFGQSLPLEMQQMIQNFQNFQNFKTPEMDAGMSDPSAGTALSGADGQGSGPVENNATDVSVPGTGKKSSFSRFWRGMVGKKA